MTRGTSGLAEIGGLLDPNSPGWLRAAEQDRVDIPKRSPHEPIGCPSLIAPSRVVNVTDERTHKTARRWCRYSTKVLDIRLPSNALLGDLWQAVRASRSDCMIRTRQQASARSAFLALSRHLARIILSTERIRKARP
jgi:hypothetical protein